MTTGQCWFYPFPHQFTDEEITSFDAPSRADVEMRQADGLVRMRFGRV